MGLTYRCGLLLVVILACAISQAAGATDKNPTHMEFGDGGVPDISPVAEDSGSQALVSLYSSGYSPPVYQPVRVPTVNMPTYKPMTVATVRMPTYKPMTVATVRMPTAYNPPATISTVRIPTVRSPPATVPSIRVPTADIPKSTLPPIAAVASTAQQAGLPLPSAVLIVLAGIAIGCAGVRARERT